MQKICVVGLGYIGLPTAAMFASAGLQVHGVDINTKIVEEISQGKCPYVEPGLPELIEEAVRLKKLTVSTTPEKADAFILSVPTPCTKEKQADMKYCNEAMKSIIPYLEEGNLIVLESTVYPGATEDVVIAQLKANGMQDKNIYVAHCPERVIPGKIVDELVNNYRVIGGNTNKSAEVAKELYSSFVKGQMYTTNLRTAEMVKLMENTFRDVNIALANEMAKICASLGINVWEAISLANEHPRVNLHQPGPGVGGHCIAVDPYFIIGAAPNLSELITTARKINSSMPGYVVDIVSQKVKKAGKVAVLGLSYKANVDDTRESPSLEIINLLKKKGYLVTAYDPYVPTSIELEECLDHADCVLITVDHTNFKSLNPEVFSLLVANKLIIDTKNIIDHDVWEKAGFEVILLGDAINKDDVNNFFDNKSLAANA
ncbi:nucleotide sugar dehydrogenase [Peptococcaceae bacterium 1198_IL3148]